MTGVETGKRGRTIDDLSSRQVTIIVLVMIQDPMDRTSNFQSVFIYSDCREILNYLPGMMVLNV